MNQRLQSARIRLLDLYGGTHGSAADLEPGGAATLTGRIRCCRARSWCAGVRQDTRDTYTLELEPTDGAPLAWLPGQFTMLHAFGVGEAPDLDQR